MLMNHLTHRGLVIALMLITVAGCSTTVKAPFEMPQAEWTQPPATDGPLAQVAADVTMRAMPIADHTDHIDAGVSGFKLLDKGEDALRWRLALIDSATQSIDTQYYLYHGDNTGLLFTSRLIEAADRGVKVRIIIDDMGTLAISPSQAQLRDSMGALMIAHPNISLRLFNSSGNRNLLGRGWNFATQFEQLNHRMHNKSLTVDNHATIMGGRNIGDEYIGLNPHFNFRDIDVLGFGPFARQISSVFDLFWNSGWVITADPSTQKKAEGIYENQRLALEQELKRSETLTQFSLVARGWESEFNALTPLLHLGRSEVVTDRPHSDGISNEVFDWVMENLPGVQKDLLVTNAYFIPGPEGVAMLDELVTAGAEVTIHTNSLASQDVAAVNSHYKAWRKPILASGVSLFEARQDAAIKQSMVDTKPVSARYMGVHSKSLVMDRRFAVIGSANLDLRSAFLNSEMIAVIDSESLAEELAQAILLDTSSANSWELGLNDKNQVIWRNDVKTVSRQPARNGWQRLQDLFFMLFPKRLY
jgi:putative cardiolipin synthase